MAIASEKRARLSIDLSLQARRRIRIAAAKRDISIRQYVLEAVQTRLGRRERFIQNPSR